MKSKNNIKVEMCKLRIKEEEARLEKSERGTLSSIFGWGIFICFIWLGTMGGIMYLLGQPALEDDTFVFVAIGFIAVLCVSFWVSLIVELIDGIRAEKRLEHLKEVLKILEAGFK